MRRDSKSRKIYPVIAVVILAVLGGLLLVIPDKTIVPNAHAAIALDGSNNASCNECGTSLGASLTTTGTSDVIVVLGGIQTSRASSACNGATATGLTFTLRYTSTESGLVNCEYYATTTSAFSGTITLGLTQTTAVTLLVFGVSGANTASPFDTGSAFGAASGSCLSSTCTSGSWSTNSANDFVFYDVVSDGNPTYTQDQCNSATATVITQKIVSSWSAAAAEYYISSSTLSGKTCALTQSVGESGSPAIDAIVQGTSTVTVPWVCSLSQFGATSTVSGFSFSVSAGSVTPSKGGCSKAGTTVNLTVNPSVTVTATARNINASGVADWFGSGANTTSTTSCSSGTCSSWAVTAYQYDTVTAIVDANAQTNFDGSMTWALTCTQSGTSGSCSISSTSATSDQKFLHVDYKSTLAFPTNPTGAPSNSRWEVSGTSSFNITTGAGTKTTQYYKQWTNTLTAHANAQTDFDTTDSITITGTLLGVSSQTICMITLTAATSDSCTGYSDNAQVATFPQYSASPPANSHWENAAGSSSNTASITSGGNTYTVQYWKQWTNTFACNPNTPSVWDNNLSCVMTGASLGSSAVTICTATLTSGSGSSSCSGYSDNGQTVSFPTPISDGSGLQWNGAGTTSFSISSGGTTKTVQYYLEFISETFQATPNTPTTWDAIYSITVSGTYLGSPATICTITTSNGGGTANCTGTIDDGTSVTFTNNIADGATARWSSATVTFTPAKSSTTTVSYYEQLTGVILKITPASVTDFTSGMTLAVTGPEYGSTITLCTITTTVATSDQCSASPVDYNGKATFAQYLSGPPTNTQWQNAAAGSSQTASITAGAGTYTVVYYDQDKMSISYSVTYGGSPTAPTWTYTYLGSAGTTYTMTTSAVTKYADAGTSCSSNSPITGGSGERWTLSSNAAACALSAGGTYSPVYYHEYQITFVVSPGGGGSTSPSGSNVWENATTLSVSATPNIDYAFSTWSASSGSITFASASSASTTATIGATGTVTATFTSTLVTLPITLTTANSAPSGTFGISGCGVGNATLSSDGLHTYSGLTPSCDITITAPAPLTYTQYVFGGGSLTVGEIFTTWTFETCSSGTCGGVSNSTEYQVGNYMNFKPLSPDVWDSGVGISVTGYIGGASGQTVCFDITTPGAGIDHCSVNTDIVFSDYDRTITFQTDVVDGLGKQWTGAAPVTFTPTSGDNNYTVNYYLQYRQSIEYSQTCHAGATCSTTPTLTYTSVGMTGLTLSETKSNVTLFIDQGTTATTSASISDSLSNVYVTSPTSWVITAPNTIAFPIPYAISTNVVVSLKATITTPFTAYNTLSIDSTASSSCNGCSSKTITLPMTAGDLILIIVSNNPSNNLATLSTVTSTHLSYLSRGSNVNNYIGGMSTWSDYAIDSSFTGTETITMSMSASTAFTIIGVSIKGANLVTPFDPNVSLPQFSFQSCSPSVPCQTYASTSNAQDMFLVGIAAGGLPITSSEAPSGFSFISNPSVTSWMGSGFAYQLTSSTRTDEAPLWTLSTGETAVIFDDAIQAAPNIIAVSGCGTNSTSLVGNGVTQHFSMTASCSGATLTMPPALGGIRYIFSKGLNGSETFSTGIGPSSHSFFYSGQFFITNNGNFIISAQNNGTQFTGLQGAGVWSDVNQNATLMGTQTGVVKITSPEWVYQEPVNGFQLVTNGSLGSIPALNTNQYLINASSSTYFRLLIGTAFTIQSITLSNPTSNVPFTLPSSNWAYFSGISGVYEVGLTGTTPVAPGSTGGSSCPPDCGATTSSSSVSTTSSTSSTASIPTGPTNAHGQNLAQQLQALFDAIFTSTNTVPGEIIIAIVFTAVFLTPRIGLLAAALEKKAKEEERKAEKKIDNSRNSERRDDDKRRQDKAFGEDRRQEDREKDHRKV